MSKISLYTSADNSEAFIADIILGRHMLDISNDWKELVTVVGDAVGVL